MSDLKVLLKKAQKKAKAIEKIKASARFRKAVGKLIKLKALQPVPDIPLVKEKLPLADFLWAGKVEPRILEVLPAILVKKPTAFKDERFPKEINELIVAIKRGEATQDFHGVQADRYLRWIGVIGGKGPTYSKIFRFSQDDLRILRELVQLGYSEAEAVREGLRRLRAAQ